MAKEILKDRKSVHMEVNGRFFCQEEEQQYQIRKVKKKKKIANLGVVTFFFVTFIGILKKEYLTT